MLLGACTPTPRPKGPSVDGALDLMFQNKYASAASQLQDLIKDRPRDARPHAAYALLLNYQQKQREALKEALAGAQLAPGDAYVLTILTRVQDWNDQFAAAVDTGGQAVKVAPQSVLARAFYAEALADLKKYEEAQAELKKAETLAAKASAYERAEVERNWANYYQSRRDYPQALTHFKQAASQQPGWVERLLELARFSLGRNDLSAATSYLKRAALLQPDDASLREELGAVALLAQDFEVAKSSFNAALKLQPRSALDLKILGDIAVALDHDLQTALRDERAALAADPTDLEAGSYLVAVIRYLQRDEAGAQQAAQHSVYPREVDSRSVATQFVDLDKAPLDRQVTALAAVNRYRRIAGVPPVDSAAKLHQSALAHAFYTFFNGASPEIRDLGIHRESRDGQGYIGDNVLARAQHFGYPVRPMAEDITHRAGPEEAVQDWIDSVFHRIPILRSDLLEIGFGAASLGPLSVQVLDMAFRENAGTSGQPILYPAPDQTDVPPVFIGNEIPDPAPKAEYPIGYPITVIFDRRARVTIQSYHLRDPAGADRPGFAQLPDNPEMENSFAFLAKEPLQPRTTYTMEVSYTINGVPSQRVWHFRTGGIPGRGGAETKVAGSAVAAASSR